MAQTERWLPVVGYERLYEVSDQGRVRSSRSGRGTFAGRMLKSWPNRAGGYLHVRLSKNSKLRTHPVHRLVATSFIGERPAGRQINHINGEHRDNRRENLEYVLPSENVLHAQRLGLLNPVRGEKHGCSVLTEKGVRRIQEALARGVPQVIIAREAKVSPSTISHISCGRKWGWLYREKK